MKREKSLWTDCSAFPKTNSCYLLSGLNELNPLGQAAGPRGMHRLSAGVLRLAFNQGRGRREASIQGILINFIQAGWSAPGLFLLSSRILNLCKV